MKLKPEFIRLKANNRLYSVNTPIVALTGGIATGKSTVARILRSKGMDIIDADQLIHQIYKRSETIEFLKGLAPQVLSHQSTGTEIDFAALRKIFFSNPQIKQNILSFLYPRMESEFLAAAKKNNHQVIIYDIPLLFERSLESLVDYVVCVYCPRTLQSARLSARDHSSPELIEQILNQQIDIEIKRQRSQYVILNSENLENLQLEVQKFIDHAFV
jgi:dephospho-CoA kinase